MKKFIGYASMTAIIAAMAVSTPAQAENGRNAAAAIGFGAGAAVGAAAASGNRYYSGPAYRETYAYQPADECRIIVRHHINRFGERVTVRERVCD